MSATAAMLQGHILTPHGWIQGTLRHGHGRITAIGGTPVGEEAVRRGTLPLLLPGFIDLHVHGGGGHDTMGGGDAATHLARTHARHGTTAL
ncbi:MAG: N-acetylglucosamine-6-phosphate deacetylase, partial [Rubrivivax sp.]|nr:N-acetylglucosamine-6-phosphate deacetylase [Rubrivivax sp.]